MDALFRCHLCDELTLASQLHRSLCPYCQNYLEPTFSRKKIAKLYLVKGGRNEKTNSRIIGEGRTSY
jgi:hypothetical protein